jgi:serine phosphatase RsbU (regulator of sigma subunit)
VFARQDRKPGVATSASTPRVAARETASFPPIQTSPALSRQFVARTLTGWAADELVDEAVLLASELVTNAVVHAGTNIDVTCLLLSEGVQVEVTDHYPVRPLPPPPGKVPENNEGGRGLQLLTLLSQAWGVDYTAANKRTWFRLRLSSGGGAASSDPPISADVASGDQPRPDVGLATFELDDQGRVRRWDAGAVALLGWTSEEVEGRVWRDLVAPDDVAVLQSWEGFGRWQGSYAVNRSDGSSLPVLARHVRLGGQADGRTMCLMVDQRWRRLLTDGPDSRQGQPQLAGDQPFLPNADLLRLELDELLVRTVEWAQAALGGGGGYALLVTDEEQSLEVRATSGLRGAPSRFSRLSIDGGITGRISRAVLPTVRDDLLQGQQPANDAWLRGAGVRSLVAVPLLAEGRLIGTVGVTSEEAGRFGVDDGVWLQRAVDEIALAVQSARLTELERSRRAWLNYVAEASELLAGTIELEMTLALVVQLVVPRLGPWCVIYLLDESGAARAQSSWHADEERLEDLRALIEKAPPPPVSATTGVEQWLPDLGSLDGISIQTSDMFGLGAHVVPLIARGRAIGALALGRDGPSTTQPEQVHLLSDLAPRAALAIDNARLYAERTATSRALQRSLLPPELPHLVGVDIAVAYEAAGATNEVGGDFYDVFPLPDNGRGGGRFAFAVGDVCGKGPEAAAVTGLARHALRLLGRRGDGIASVLSHLNAAILDEGSRTRFVTLVYGEGQTRPDGTLQLRFASAGHPAPVLLRVDGTTAAVGEAGDLLGVFDAIEATVTELLLAPDETLVCFTDGVTERREGDRMLGEAGVLAALSGCAGMAAATVVRRLQDEVDTFAAAPPRDDLAILALRARQG